MPSPCVWCLRFALLPQLQDVGVSTAAAGSAGGAGVLIRGLGSTVVAVADATVRIAHCDATTVGGGVLVTSHGMLRGHGAIVVDGCSAGSTGGGVAAVDGGEVLAAALTLTANTAG